MIGKRMFAAIATAMLFSSVAVAQDAAKPEVSADQLSEEQLRLKLYEFLIDSLAGKDLAVEEIPKFARDYCTWGVIDGLVSAIIWAAVIAALSILAVKFIKAAKSDRCGDWAECAYAVFSAIFIILIIIFAAAPLSANVKQACKAAYAPRAYIADTLMEKLSYSPPVQYKR